MLKLRYRILMVILVAVTSSLMAGLPEKGMPFMQRFFPPDFHFAGKVWGIHSAPNGIVYMASDRGLLEYDGKNWNIFRGSRGFMRSVLVLNDSVIYSGSDMDFGIWTRNKQRGFDYQSLFPFSNDPRDASEEFWHTYSINNKILYVSSQSIYIHTGQQITRLPAPSEFSGSYAINDSLFLTDKQEGIMLLHDLGLTTLAKHPSANTIISLVGVYYHGGSLNVVTRNHGLYQLNEGQLVKNNTLLSSNLEKEKVFSFMPVNNDQLAFGTIMKGLYITNKDEQVIHHINKHKGLPNNTILSLHQGAFGKIWIGMDYGISSLNIQSSVRYFFDNKGEFETGYTASLLDGRFYLGTNQGLFWSTWDELNNNAESFRLRLIPGTEGQVWALKHINGVLYIGHDQGLYTFKDNKLQRVSDQVGVWTIVQHRNYLLTGNYNGISIFKKTGSDLQFLKRMELVLGSCNQIVFESDEIVWVNIPTFGVIRVTIDSNFLPLDRNIFSNETFEGDNISLVKRDNSVLIITNRYDYHYRHDSMTFSKVPNEYGIPVQGLLEGIYQPVILDDNYEFFPVYNGFALNYRKAKYSGQLEKASLVLRNMEAYNNHQKHTVYPGAGIPFNFHNLRFDFIVPNSNKTLYQYRLGSSSDWINKEPRNYIELYGLPDGNHTLFVRALADGNRTGEIAVSFRILRPWYRTWIAYLAYLVLFVVFLLLARLIYKSSLRKHALRLLQKEEDYLRQLATNQRFEKLTREKEQIKKEISQLDQLLKQKTMELADKSRANQKKIQLLSSLRERCDQVKRNPSSLPIHYQEMQRLLESFHEPEDKTFELQIDELNKEFYQKLRKRFPRISKNDLRFCAYLKMGLNSKEIAGIMNIQPSSAYINRSRLRKKLELKVDEDLYEFLNSI